MSSASTCTSTSNIQFRVTVWRVISTNRRLSLWGKHSSVLQKGKPRRPWFILSWLEGLSCKRPLTPSHTHSSNRVCRHLEKVHWDLKSQVRLLSVWACSKCSAFWVSVSHSAKEGNWTKWPQKTMLFSPFRELWQCAHSQPLFQPQQWEEHRRMVREDLWVGPVQSIAVLWLCQ